MQWKVTNEYKFWELDLLEYEKETDDLYEEIMSKKQFNFLY